MEEVCTFYGYSPVHGDEITANDWSGYEECRPERNWIKGGNNAVRILRTVRTNYLRTTLVPRDFPFGVFGGIENL